MPQILTEEMKRFMEDKLHANDEVTSTMMKDLLLEKWPDLKVSIPTIKRVRRQESRQGRRSSSSSEIT